MFDPKKDISDLFEKGKKIIGDVHVDRITETEFRERVKKIILENYGKEKIDIIDLDKGYETALSLVPNMNYSLKDVITLIEEYQTKHESGFCSPGIYLSALINRIIKDDDVISIDLKKDRDRRDSFFKNIGMFLPRGKLIVNGDVYHEIGYRMSGGELVINGDCNGNPGEKMKGGKITIKGNIDNTYSTGECPSYKMEGGELEVLGNVKINSSGLRSVGIGYEMKGGRIHIKGNLVGNDPYPGYRMEDGEIIIGGDIVGAYSSMGGCMKGGIIKIKGYCSSAGWNMEGGTVILNKGIGISYDHKEIPLSIGYRMKGGEIIVNDNAYASVGWKMIDGTIEICGDLKVNGDLGWEMQDGCISVKGNVYGSHTNTNIGLKMTGGEINIKGNVDGKVGNQMEGGTIKIDGYMTPDSNYKFTEKPVRYGGAVYTRGQLVKDNIATKIGKWFDKKR